VLDIDLAGRLYPRRGGEDIRVMNGGADWPRMRLRTRWSRMARVRSGDEQLANMNYMQRINRYWETDPLRYEKQMLDDWFDKTIVQNRHAERCRSLGCGLRLRLILAGSHGGIWPGIPAASA
jgi:hypothetical protein